MTQIDTSRKRFAHVMEESLPLIIVELPHVRIQILALVGMSRFSDPEAENEAPTGQAVSSNKRI